MEPRPGLGKVLVVLGILGLIRLIPEAFQIRSKDGAYAMLVAMDAVLALATGAAGEGSPGPPGNRANHSC